MFGVSPAEILTIAVVALVVFGPKRLPEMSRKAGKVLREIKDSAEELRRGIEAEAEAGDGLGEARRSQAPTLGVTPPPAEGGGD